MGKYRLLVALIFVAFWGLNPSMAQLDTGSRVLTLESCIGIALQQHTDAVQQQLRLAQGKADLRQSRYNLLPELSMGASHGWSQGRYIDPTTNLFVTQRLTSGSQWATSSVTLFDGLASFRRITAQAYALKVSEMDALAIQNRLVLQVAAAYITALAARDMVEQVRNQIFVTEARMKRTETMHAEGAVSPADYYDVKGEYQADLNRLVDAQQHYRQSLVELARLLNQPVPDDVMLQSLTDIPFHLSEVESTGELYEAALSHLGMIKAADYRQQQAKQELRVLRSGFLPRLNLSGGFQSRYAGTVSTPYYTQMNDNLGSFASLNLSIPIFNRFANRTQVAKARLDVKDAELQAQARRHELQQDVKAAWIDLEASRERYGNLEDQLEQYAESFRIAQLRFDIGDTNALEYLTAKNRSDNAEINLILARYQWHLRQFIVDFYQGTKNYLMQAVPPADE